MRKALVVGIDYYKNGSALHGCVNDAYSVKNVLERHSDGTVNFGVKLLTATSQQDAISRSKLKENIRELFTDDSEIALFYFSGHGHIEQTGGYLLSSECHLGDDGVSLSEVLTLANASKARNKIIVLDSCHSGIAGTPPSASQNADLSEGLTILTASTAYQYATEVNKAGVFTTLFVDALNGSAANLVGDITPGSVYAHIDQSLGPWQQRPVFKTNVERFVSLRKVQPPISLEDLQLITKLFPTAGFNFQLDPTFEPERSVPKPENIPDPIPENTRKFAVLQKYNRVNLVIPVDAPHMWHAAMESKSCKLTVLGEHYRSLVERGLI
ncbi:MAG: caspase family protein [Alphaproteobacteria bacterium]|nr:caspase family protein [Alphaproteobacteria bacterium]